MSEERYLIKVNIRNNDTGEIVQYDCLSGKDDEDGNFNNFIWEEGNFSCDCNRELFFIRAKGIDEDEIEVTGICKGSGKYSVEILNEQGGLLYSDYDE